jgi:phosphatidylinositol-bisphosphatase
MVESCARSRVVLFGDLNYRIAMDDDDEARQLVRARKWSMLLEKDELLLELSSGRQFDGWHEGHVAFAPTYKYRRNSDQFYWCADGGATGREKQHRAPAWSCILTVSIFQVIEMVLF